MSCRALLVERDIGVRRCITDALRLWAATLWGEELEVHCPPEGEVMVAETIAPCEIALIDTATLGTQGLLFLARLRHRFPGLPFILLSAIRHDPDEEASSIFRLRKPFGLGELRAVLAKARPNQGPTPLKVEQPGEEIVGPAHGLPRMGRSRAIRALLETIGEVAPTDATILLLGETGTGKELIAKATHQLSRRSHGPFEKAVIPEYPASLIESELFGHDKGAFTGADARKQGKFAAAHGGTLFLDEVGDIPLELQVKVLRFLQDRSFERVGSGMTEFSDVRVIAATHRDLRRLVQEGKFREDLYYRLAVVPIQVPPLRERAEDIPVLLAEFLQSASRRHGRGIPALTPEAMGILQTFQWPGNVRLLQSFAERLILLHRSGEVTREAVLRLLPERSDPERERIEQALDGRTVQQAADLLGWNRSTLQDKMKKYGIRRRM